MLEIPEDVETIISKLGTDTIAIAKDKIADGCYTKEDIEEAKRIAIYAIRNGKEKK